MSSLTKIAGNRPADSPGLSRIVGNTSSHVGILTEQLNEKTLNGTRRAGVGDGVICNPRKLGSGFVRKAMHRTAVDDELPVGISLYGNSS